jgi:hypothetical protein
MFNLKGTRVVARLILLFALGSFPEQAFSQPTPPTQDYVAGATAFGKNNTTGVVLIEVYELP